MKGNDQRLERVTSVLPCAEVPLTLANLAEYILTDIWVRFRKQDGRPVLRGYIDDALDASRSRTKEPAQREAAALEAARRPRTLKLFQLEGDAVSAAGDHSAGVSVRGPGAVHLFSAEGPGLTAETYLRHLDPSALRYNVAAAYNGVPADMRIAPDDFRENYNRDVVELFAGIFAELGGHEFPGFGENDSPNGAEPDAEKLRSNVTTNLKLCREAYDVWDFARVLELARESAGVIRAYMNGRRASIHHPSPERGAALGAARVLSAMLAPILPVFAAGVKEFLVLTVPPSFEDAGEPPPNNHACCTYRPLAAPLEDEDLRAMFAAASDAGTAAAASAGASVSTMPRRSGLISPDELGRVELRAGLVVSTEIVEGADKLLRLEIDLGENEARTVLAGLREAYEPEELRGMTLLCVANLPPRETRFGVSTAMILAAGEPPVVFAAQRSVAPGARLR